MLNIPMAGRVRNDRHEHVERGLTWCKTIPKYQTRFQVRLEAVRRGQVFHCTHGAFHHCHHATGHTVHAHGQPYTVHVLTEKKILGLCNLNHQLIFEPAMSNHRIEVSTVECKL